MIRIGVINTAVDAITSVVCSRLLVAVQVGLLFVFPDKVGLAVGKVGVATDVRADLVPLFSRKYMLIIHTGVSAATPTPAPFIRVVGIDIRIIQILRTQIISLRTRLAPRRVAARPKADAVQGIELIIAVKVEATSDRMVPPPVEPPPHRRGVHLLVETGRFCDRARLLE